MARLYLDNFANIQSSWVTQGLKIGQLALLYGANDMGSLMIEENVVAEAGTVHHLTLDEIRERDRGAGLQAAAAQCVLRADRRERRARASMRPHSRHETCTRSASRKSCDASAHCAARSLRA